MADGNITSSLSFGKVCPKCRISKPSFEFNKSQSRCKPCHRADSSAWQKANREKVNANRLLWAKRNPDRVRQYARKTYDNMTVDQRLWKAQKSRLRYYKKKYGLTPETWKALYDAQGGVCAICRIPGRTGRHDILYVDHCHDTGRVRGLLCSGCNVAIAALGDSAEKLARVVAYLQDGTEA